MSLFCFIVKPVKVSVTRLESFELSEPIFWACNLKKREHKKKCASNGETNGNSFSFFLT